MKKLFLALALLATPIYAQAEREPFDPAAIMPADTIVFAQADGGAVAANLGKLDIVRVLYGEAFKSFFEPLRENLPPTVADLTNPISMWLPGHAAVGVSGISVRLQNFDGTWERIRITPGNPIKGTLFHKMLRSAWVAKRGPSIIWDLEAVAVVEPGPAMREALSEFLEDPPIPFEQKVVQRGARQILTLKFEPFVEDDIWMAPEIHADLTGDRWIIATTEDLLDKAMGKEKRATLADDAQFKAARQRHTSGARALFLYGDARKFLEVAQPLLPPVAREMADDEGITSILSFSVGWSMVEGGIRESWGVGLNENPKGFWRLLDSMPTGLDAIKWAPKRAVGIVATKFDAALFMKRFDEVVGGLFPGTEKMLRGEWAQMLLEGGINLETDVLPGLGDEVALIAMPPGGFGVPIPDLLFAMKVRDEAAFGRLMGSLGKLSEPPVVLKAAEPVDGKAAWLMQWPVPPGKMDFRIHSGHLLGSTSPIWMRHWTSKWDAPPDSLAKDGVVFQQVMKGMTGGNADDLALLVYGDLRVYLPLLTAFAAGTGVLPDELFKTKPMPDLRKMGDEFSGIAIGIRRDKHGVAFESFGPTGGFVSLMSVAPIMFWTAAPMVVRAGGVPVPVR